MIAPLDNNASYVAASETIRQKRHRLRQTSGYLLKGERVNGCGRKRHSQTVDIHRTAKGAHFVGLETCGSVWHCPVCAARIAEQRREEVAQAIEGAREAGGAAYMLTLTMRHNRKDNLKYLKSAIADSWRKVQNRRAYRDFKARFGVRGTIRAIEVTYGNANGWHPHLHILFITKRAFDGAQESEAQAILFELWSTVLTSMTDRYVALDALDFRPATTSDYVTKWGTDRELVKGQQKEGKSSLSPWQILDAFARGDKHAGKLFQEYATTFKGARQLTWSKGLKDHFNIGDVTDEDAATCRTEAAHDTAPADTTLPQGRIGVLDRVAFDAAVRRQVTAHILDIAHAEGWDGVLKFLGEQGITPTMPTSSEWPQPPAPVDKPVQPNSYPKWDTAEFMRLGNEAKARKLESDPNGFLPGFEPGSTGFCTSTASPLPKSYATGTGKPRCAYI
jgi:hypothetical protein